jgi:hypothetical protein
MRIHGIYGIWLWRWMVALEKTNVDNVDHQQKISTLQQAVDEMADHFRA